jgi:hypothetical protein
MPLETVRTQEALGIEKDEAIERLWAEMRVAPEVDFAAIAAQVFGPPDPASEIVLDTPINKASVQDTLESFESFERKHASSFGDAVRELLRIVLPGGAVMLLGLGAAAVGGAPYLWSVMLFLLTAVVIVLVLAGLKPYAAEWFERMSMVAVGIGPSFGEVSTGAVMGSLALGTAGLVAFLGVNRANDLAADGQIAKTTLVRLAIHALGTKELVSQCRPLMGGASDGEIMLIASHCDETEALYRAALSNDPDAEAWSATVGKQESKITWSDRTSFRLLRASSKTWTVIPGVTISANDSEVEVMDEEGKTRKFVPDKSAVLPKVGSKVAVEFRDAQRDRALFWNLPTQ